MNIITYNESTSSIRENAANLVANYLEAVKLLNGGKDDVNSRLWWDVADINVK